MVRRKSLIDADTDAAITFRVCELLLAKKRPPVEQIATEISKEFNVKVSREMIYPYLAKAIDRGFLQLVAPMHETLVKDLATKFNLAPESLQVVNTMGPTGREHVAVSAAHLVVELVKKVEASKPTKERGEVRIGLGPGRATRDFCRSFSALLQSDAKLPQIGLVAITAGAPAMVPEFASPSFFNLFPVSQAKRIGLFGETLVRADQLPDILKRPGVMEAYGVKDEIDIVVTSMGDPKDGHDLLTTFLNTAEQEIDEEVVGNVQYRPYSTAEPILETGNKLRALTIFELEDFRQMATESRNRYVVLLARECALCNSTRVPAILPLLQSPQLKVWSHLIIDIPTARALDRISAD